MHARLHDKGVMVRHRRRRRDARKCGMRRRSRKATVVSGHPQPFSILRDDLVPLVRETERTDDGVKGGRDANFSDRGSDALGGDRVQSAD
jgi:hypothetical protein